MNTIVHLQLDAEDVRRYLEQAATIVGELELDGDLKVPAFDKAVDLLAGTHLVVEQQQPMLGHPRAPLLG